MLILAAANQVPFGAAAWPTSHWFLQPTSRDARPGHPKHNSVLFIFRHIRNREREREKPSNRYKGHPYGIGVRLPAGKHVLRFNFIGFRNSIGPVQPRSALALHLHILTRPEDIHGTRIYANPHTSSSLSPRCFYTRAVLTRPLYPWWPGLASLATKRHDSTLPFDIHGRLFSSVQFAHLTACLTSGLCLPHTLRMKRRRENGTDQSASTTTLA
ncbi:hypothetical protein LX36DRAFT_283221 [Colletotrichum falcatum]|nr:hypothetical protein LX36DRAFT_283221 [Colletotrichum falcatum]